MVGADGAGERVVVGESTMMLDPHRLPQVLPTDRLLANGMAQREIRSELRRIANIRNALSVVMVWASVAALIALAVWLGPIGFVVAFVLMVPMHVRLAILMHEAAHKLLFSNGRVNDWVGKWLIAYPAFVPIDLYRSAHFAHHKEEFGPNEPDIEFYSGYPGPPSALRRRLIRDATGISGWKNLTPLFRSAVKGPGRDVSLPIIAVQLVLWALMWWTTGLWFVYPVLWLAPWMTGWRVVNRLRALGEHGGLGPSKDRRITTHNVRQSWLARFWFVPWNTGWHLAHHVDMGIPWRNLPRFHAELEQAGYIDDTMTYRSYLALWRALCSKGDPLPARVDAGSEACADGN
ncbi:MAG: fatty acid desaturase [Acidimicrobiia bacterium]|nr:fatty acid desaturase [Acidimicrobiia bacterium]